MDGAESTSDKDAVRSWHNHNSCDDNLDIHIYIYIYILSVLLLSHLSSADLKCSNKLGYGIGEGNVTVTNTASAFIYSRHSYVKRNMTVTTTILAYSVGILSLGGSIYEGISMIPRIHIVSAYSYDECNVTLCLN